MTGSPAKVGGGIGIVAGPAGGIVGTIPCAIIGGLIVFLAGEKVGCSVTRHLSEGLRYRERDRGEDRS